MAKSPDAFRTIREVAEWLDTPAHVLRFWESKFSQIKPVKRAGGRRYYRPADMLLIGGIKKLLHEDGMTIKGVRKLLHSEGVKFVSTHSQALDILPASDAKSNAGAALEHIPTGTTPPQPEAAEPVAETGSIEDDVPSAQPDDTPMPEQASDDHHVNDPISATPATTETESLPPAATDLPPLGTDVDAPAAIMAIPTIETPPDPDDNAQLNVVDSLLVSLLERPWGQLEQQRTALQPIYEKLRVLQSQWDHR